VPIPSFSQTFPSGLTLDEYALKKAPQNEPLTFEPVQGSQAAILAKHQAQRDDYYSPKTVYGSENLIYPSSGDDQYLAKEIFTLENSANKVSVEVLKGERTIYAAQAGDLSPLDVVRGLWIYGSDWTVEYAYVTNTQTQPNEIDSHPIGQIVLDGTLLNKKDGLQEAFGFQLLKGLPFYFYQQHDQVRVSYAGQKLPITYDEIPHYGCCSQAALNPRQAKNMAAFFARRDQTWYYVEIGSFE
jgi:hypothetical protein